MITKAENLRRKAALNNERVQVKIHFTKEELDEMEKRARELSRMDWTDKVKLISQARHAIMLESMVRMLGQRMSIAIDHLGCGIDEDVQKIIEHTNGK